MMKQNRTVRLPCGARPQPATVRDERIFRARPSLLAQPSRDALDVDQMLPRTRRRDFMWRKSTIPNRLGFLYP